MMDQNFWKAFESIWCMIDFVILFLELFLMLVLHIYYSATWVVLQLSAYPIDPVQIC